MMTPYSGRAERRWKENKEKVVPVGDISLINSWRGEGGQEEMQRVGITKLMAKGGDPCK